MKNASIVNVAGIDDKRSLHKILKEALDLPDYYGGNLVTGEENLKFTDTVLYKYYY